MTEAEWLASDDPGAMLAVAAGRMTDRKHRLFACNCLRAVGPCVPQPAGLAVVEAVERWADGEADHDEVEAVLGRLLRPGHLGHEAWPFMALFDPPGADPTGLVLDRALAVGEVVYPPGVIHAHTAGLLRDCCGPLPFRAVELDPRWRTTTARAVAWGVYTGRHPDRLPILADALEDAGCDDADVLDHGRADGFHTRGCWVVDLVLGKS